MRSYVRKFAVALGIVTLACSSGDITSSLSQATDPSIPSSVVITPPTSPDLIIGTSVSLVVAVRNITGQNISNLPVAWSSSDPTVATVSSTGVVNGIKLGTVVISGTVGGISASVTINVKPVPVASVAVSVANTLFVGDAATAIAVPLDSASHTLVGRNVTWASRSPTVATVSPAGVVTGVAAGTASIAATVDGVTGSATVVTSARPSAIASIVVTLPESLVVTQGKTLQANAAVTDSAGGAITGKPIAWTSSNPAVATISALGVVTAVASGSTTITATSQGVSGIVTLLVQISNVSAANVASVTAVSPIIGETQSTQATAVIKDNFGNLLNPAVTWTSSDPTVATVSPTGKITGVNAGYATVAASGAGATASITIQVIPVSVNTVTLTASNTTIPVGATTSIVAVVRDGSGNVLARPVTWASSTPGIATVNSAGLVTGVSLGQADIVASIGSATAQVTVTVSVPPVATVYVTSPLANLQPTQTAQTAVVLRDLSGNVLSGRVIAYSSSDPAIATVSATGVVTGVAAGTVQISALSEGKTGTVTITIPPVAQVTVSAPLTTLQLGQTTQATVVLRDAQFNPVTNRVVVWSSSNPAAFTVSNTGLVTAVGSGTSQITVTSEGATGSVPMTVSAVTTVTITSAVSTLQPGQTAQTTVVLRDQTGNTLTGRPISYASSNPAVATVDAAGLVTAVAAGTVQITATSQGVSGSATITVPPVTQVLVTAPQSILQPTQTTQAVVALRDAQSNAATNRAIVWASSNPAALTVSNTGFVTAVGPGTSLISVTSEGVTGSLSVTVPPVATVLVTGTNLFPIPAQTTQLNATLLDAASNPALNRAVVWASSAPTVATVSNTGLVTGVAIGTTTITVTSEGRTGSVSIQVVSVSPPVVMPPVATVAVSASPSTLQPTQTTATTVVLRDAGGNLLSGRQVTYSSSNPAIASVDGAGRVTALSSGSVQIIALSEGQTGAVTITIPPVAQVTVTAPVTTLLVGQTTQASVTLRDAQGNPVSNRIAVWSSSNPAAFTVSNSGFVTAVGAGSASIIVTSEGATGSVTIAVPSVATVYFTAPNTTLQPGQTTQSTVVLRDISGNILTGHPVTYSSGNSAIATVDAAGLITAVGSGTVQVTATSAGKTGSVTINVPAVTQVTVTANVSSLQPTQTTQAAVTLLDASSQPVINRVAVWSSSNPAALTVSSTGAVTAVGPGTAQVVVTSEGATGSVTITVPPVNTITLTGTNQPLNPRQTTQLTATLLDAGSNPALFRVVTWSSSVPAVATVSNTGIVTGVSVGSTTITASSEGKTATFPIQVDQVVGSVTVSSPVSSMLVGETAQLSALILDPNGIPITTLPPIWSTSNAARATISATGLVTQVQAGSLANVTFTATLRGFSSARTISMVGHKAEVLAELPRVFVNTSMPAAPAAGRVVIGVSTTNQLVNALVAAQPGDVIELANGVTFTGNFILPNKNTPSTNWITLRPANTSGLPAQGSRMTPSIASAANLPKLVSPNNQGAIATAFGAHHYRLIGLEVTNTRGVVNTGLVRLGGDGTDGQTTMATVPHDLVIDRMFIHGDATTIVRRCVALNSAMSAVIDSYISDCHDNGQDAQAIAGWNGPGPFKVVNNYLEGSGENMMFGGGDAAIAQMVPSDIEVRRNHFFKPLSWKGVWMVKNLFELKDAVRILIEANIFENVWQDAQDGTAIKFKSTNQNQTAPWSGSQDVTFRFNLVRNVGAALALAAAPDNTAPTNRLHLVTITDNLWMNINVAPFDGAGRGALISQDISEIVIAHNTIMDPGTGAFLFSPPDPTNHLWIRDNVTSGIVKGDALTGGGPTVATTMPNGGFYANVLVNNYNGGYPPQSFYPTTNAAVGFMNLAGGDLRLSPSSLYAHKGTDGANPGADIDAIMAMTAGVIVP